MVHFILIIQYKINPNFRCTLPRMGAIKAVLEEIGPNGENGTIRRTRSGKVVQLIKDTVGAIREKKYVKGWCQLNGLKS
jgi:hypothetical protein